MTAGGPVLRDIHLPAAAWWPLAPGWWIVAALALLAGCAIAWFWWRHARRALSRAALREVDVLATAYARDRDARRLAEGASRLLRRVACVVDPAVASRSGEAWRNFVHHYARNAQAEAALARLGQAVFRPFPDIDPTSTLAALRAFCQRALRSPHPGTVPRGEGTRSSIAGASGSR